MNHFLTDEEIRKLIVIEMVKIINYSNVYITDDMSMLNIDIMILDASMHINRLLNWITDDSLIKTRILLECQAIADQFIAEIHMN